MERIRKINIEKLISLLDHLWNSGVDYVDISKKPDTEEEDVLGISFCREYMDEDYKHLFEEFDESELSDDSSETEEKIEVKLSDDDLNQLI